MTGRERYEAVFSGRRPDRYPISLFIQDQGHLLNQLFPDIRAEDYDALQRASVDVQRELGSDVMLRILFDGELPLHVLFGGVNIWAQTETWQVNTTEAVSGSTRILSSVIRTPQGDLTQEFTIFRMHGQTLMYACTKKPVKEESDLDLVIRYEPKMNPRFPASIKARAERMRQYVGSDGIVGAWVPYGPFNTASLLIDHEELYSLFLTDPEYFDKLLSFCVTRFEDYVRAFQQSGLDVYFVGGNVPGGFMGRKNYETYALPYEKRFIDLCQSDGKPCIYHNCGSIMPLIESYKLLGSRVVEPFSPKPLGDADLPRAVETIGNAYVMICGVDQVNIIQKGTEKDVVEATERTAKALLGHDNCILQNADFFEYGTPLENIRAFVDTAKRCAAT